MLINPYCSVEQVQKEIRNAGSELVPELETAINTASRWIDRYKGNDFFQHDHTTSPLVIWPHSRAITGYCTYLNLPYWPVIELTEVKVAGVVWSENQHYIKPADEPWCLIAINGSGWSTAFDYNLALKLKGKFGYAQADPSSVPQCIPGYINQACILLAATFSGHNRKEIISVTGQKELVVSKEIPKAVYDLLGSRQILI